MAKVRIQGTNQLLEASPEANFLEILQAAQFPISTSCGGRASCGLCRLTVTSGKEFLTPLTPAELPHLGNVASIIGTRLACQTRLRSAEGTVEVSVPAVEDVEARKRKKSERLQRERAQQRARVSAGNRPEAGPIAETIARPERPREWRPRMLQGQETGQRPGQRKEGDRG